MEGIKPRWFGAPVPSVRLDEAETIPLGGREWVAVHTPGHTPDHLCLYDPDGGVLLSGDHVLPTITPHISGLSADAVHATVRIAAVVHAVAVALEAHEIEQQLTAA